MHTTHLQYTYVRTYVNAVISVVKVLDECMALWSELCGTTITNICIQASHCVATLQNKLNF